MREDRIGTLRLEGEDVTNFVNSFFKYIMVQFTKKK